MIRETVPQDDEDWNLGDSLFWLDRFQSDVVECKMFEM